MMGKGGLDYKLIRLFVLQIVLISVAILFAVFAAAKVVEDILLRHALEGEAAHFWHLYEKDPHYPWPNTMNMMAYLAIGDDFSEVPPPLHTLQPGYGRAALNHRQPIVYVEDLDNARLFLVFDEEQVTELSFYFGIVPLSLVLILIYLFAWLSYRQTRKAISPVVQLAHKVNQFNFREQSLGELDLSEFRQFSDSEVIVLLDALEHFTERLQLFIEREQNFTRDASHELRTPLAVIKSSLALLQKRASYEFNESKALQMIDKTVRDMEALIESLLLLAREESSPLPKEDILVNDLIRNLLDQIRPVMGSERVTVNLEEKCLLTVNAPEKVLTILFANLLRNAFSYTQEGFVSIVIDQGQVSISDSGVGMEQRQLDKVFEPFYRGQAEGKRHGLGLAIVKRCCNLQPF